MNVPARALEHPNSFLDEMIPDESELTAGSHIEPGKRYGFFTDTTLCIGCKACEVACKEWNVLPSERDDLSGMSYDNTKALGATTWRHVAFVEKIDARKAEGHSDEIAHDGTSGDATGSGETRAEVNEMPPFQSNWLMMSDVCKHCANAPCLEACPTGAIFRTEFDTVVVQQDICNGCGYCVPACPFSVVDIDPNDGKAHKCTLCYDRLKGGLEPACAKACPTDSIQFGELDDLDRRARERVERLHEMGQREAYLYGAPGTPGATGNLERLNAFFLLIDEPEVYNLPSAPTRPADRVMPSLTAGIASFAGLAAAAFLMFGRGRGD